MTIVEFQRLYGGLSNDDMARLIGCSRQAILHWKSGRRRMPAPVARFLKWVHHDCRGNVPEFTARWRQALEKGAAPPAGPPAGAAGPAEAGPAARTDAGPEWNVVGDIVSRAVAREMADRFGPAPGGAADSGLPAPAGPEAPAGRDAVPRSDLLLALRQLADEGLSDAAGDGRAALVRMHSVALRLARPGAPAAPSAARDLRSVVHDARELLAAGLPPAVRLEVAQPPALPVMAAVDAVAVEDALANLAAIVAGATGQEGGTVSVSVASRALRVDAHPRLWLPPGAAEGPCAAVTVSTETSCMPDEALALLFETPSAPSPVESVLGMTAVLSAMRRHRGAVAVETRGHGLAVTLYIPATP